jgi:hypothetical protein
MELIKVEEQFFAGLGFSISGDAWVMGNDNSDRRLLSLTGMEGFSWQGRFSSDVFVRTLIRNLKSSTLDFKEGSVTQPGSGTL